MLARMRAEGAGRPSDAILVMGDFNSGPTNAAFRTLTSAPDLPLHDLHRVLAPYADWGGAFNGLRGDSTGEKIDAILGLGVGGTGRRDRPTEVGRGLGI